MQPVIPTLLHVNSRWPAIPAGHKAIGLVDGILYLRDSAGNLVKLLSDGDSGFDEVYAAHIGHTGVANGGGVLSINADPYPDGY